VAILQHYGIINFQKENVLFDHPYNEKSSNRAT
jgi:hypothetical protein